MKIKLLLLGLITPLLSGVSFGINLNQDTIDYINSIAFASGSNLSSTAGYIDLYHVPNPVNNSYLNYCVLLSGFKISSSSSFVVRFNGDLNTSTSTPFYVSNLNYNLYCATGRRKYFQISFYSSTAYTLDKYWVFNANDILNQSSFYDCSSIQSQLNTCSNALSGVSANLSSCQSDLSSCSNSCDTLVNQCLFDKSFLSGSLANCQENNSSLQNYNDSLSSQLNECLASSGSFGSGANLIQFDIFRKDGNIDYSLPITNNLFLPYGYKGKLNEDRVLTISKNNSSEYSLSIDDLSFDNDVVAMLGKLFVFFMSLGLFCVFLYTIRRYFIGLKSIK